MASRISDIGCPRGADKEALHLTIEAVKKTRRSCSDAGEGRPVREEGLWRSIPIRNPGARLDLFLRQQGSRMVMRWVQYRGGGPETAKIP